MTIDDIFKKVDEDRETSESILFDMEWKHEYYNEIPGALDTFKGLASSIIKENIKKLIKYEKTFILHNEFFIDINKQLNINN